MNKVLVNTMIEKIAAALPLVRNQLLQTKAKLGQYLVVDRGNGIEEIHPSDLPFDQGRQDRA